MPATGGDGGSRHHTVTLRAATHGDQAPLQVDAEIHTKVGAEVGAKFEPRSRAKPEFNGAQVEPVGQIDAVYWELRIQGSQLRVEAVQAAAGLGVGFQPVLPLDLGRGQLVTALLQSGNLASQAVAFASSQALEALRGISLPLGADLSLPPVGAPFAPSGFRESGVGARRVLG